MRHSSNAHMIAQDEPVHRLRDALLRVTESSETLREEKATLSKDCAELIDRLSQEIDETVLPRKLALLSDTGVAAVLVVSNRRLIELEIDARKIVIDAEKDSDADTVARSYAAALKTLSARSGPLRLRSVCRAPQIATGSTACTARHLAKYSTASSFENRMKAFLKLCHPSSMGWIYWSGDGQNLAHDPHKDTIKRLRVLEQQLEPQANNQGSLSRLDRSGPICSAFALSEDLQAVIATDGKDRLIAAFPRSKIAAVMTNWHQVFKHARQ
ncbi:MAG: hypothetical protein AAFW87_03315 [Pseudomonadota bacterium]